MNRDDLERLVKPELIDLVLGLQRPDKTSHIFEAALDDRKASARRHAPLGHSLGTQAIPGLGPSAG